MSKTVYVGLSGGVDSSLSAALLQQQGYKVIGVYMKNWSRDIPGWQCPWKEDYQDAKRVAVQLGIPFKLYDFETEYRHKVVDYMIAEYQAGRTPNPDIMCNQEVKFKLFLDTALQDGADMIATGHYAKIKETGNRKQETKSTEHGTGDTEHGARNAKHGVELHMAKDKNKDQTYFLYRVTNDALSKTLFPLGDLTKPEVRKMAKDLGLTTADKAESMGICFVGKVGIRDFLLNELGPQTSGLVIDQNGVRVGEHDGAIFYTIGQRHGLKIGGGLPYYVTGKNMAKNEVYVSRVLDDANLWSKAITIADAHWLSPIPPAGLKVRTRHRAALVEVKSYQKLNSGRWTFQLKEAVRAVTPGQSAVFYQAEQVFGGGIVC